uniref:Nicotinamide/nicotinic acid mononucleotide adenylyltransferase 2 n=1 Tax=Eptatretus burgeri TaxID=7764 RepID=A0A8C4Q4S8_EPTBU
MSENCKTHAILLACGSFNPVTRAHVHMFETARNFLHQTARYIVIGGIISPVHEGYRKQGLISSQHRLSMCQLAVQNSDWIRVDPWECYQETWQPTCNVLQHHRELMKRVMGCILSNVNSPSSPIVAQPHTEAQVNTIQLDQNHKVMPGKLLSKLGESVSRVCCFHPRSDVFPYIDENANLGSTVRYEEIELRIMLLCGSDLLESFSIPGLWKDEDLRVILGEFGLVCVPRDGTDTEQILRRSRLLSQYKKNILVAEDASFNPTAHISSTKSRLALQKGDGRVSEYLTQPIIDYILQNQLYMSTSG